MHFNFSSCCCEELWKKDMITNSRGLPSSFIYVVLVAGQDPGWTEVIVTFLCRSFSLFVSLHTYEIL